MREIRSGNKSWGIALISFCGIFNALSSTWAASIPVDEVIPKLTAEAVYPKELNTVASEGVLYSKKVMEAKMLSKGSAIITSSGDLSVTGITAIVHAVFGSMISGGGPLYEPNLVSVSTSIKNAIALVKRHGHSSIAIPFAGRDWLVARIGVNSEKLAEAMIRTVLENRSGLQVSFITSGNASGLDNTLESADTKLMKSMLVRILNEAKYKDVGSAVQVLQGNITDYYLHNSTVIMNTAFMEGRFGGGISGTIAQRVGNAAAIDNEAAEIAKRFNARALEKFRAQN